MAGDEDRDRIGAAGGADGARNSAGGLGEVAVGFCAAIGDRQHLAPYSAVELGAARLQRQIEAVAVRSEEHTSELQSLMRISYAVFCLKKKKDTQCTHNDKMHQIET